MFTDFVLNGQMHGQLGSQLQLQGTRFDPGLLRPYIDDNGERCVTVNTGRMQQDKKSGLFTPVHEKVRISELINNGVYSPVFNATSLRKLEWVMLDQMILTAARQRLRAWADLAGANTFGGFNGMAKMLLEHETMSDPGEAIVDMDGLAGGRTDEPHYQLEGLPLPITHSEFWFSARRLAESRNSGTPLSFTMAEAAARRVAEMVEKITIGTVTGTTYGTASDYGRAPTVYGYTNFPNRVTKTNMTAPTGSNGPAVLASWLALRELMTANKFYGPFMVYTSTDWDQYLDNDYYASGGNNNGQTLRTRLKQIDGITDIRRLDFLTNTFTVLFVQMTADVARAVNGLDLTTVQWESKGGMQLNFKVMCIYVPQLRADFYGNCGIGHGTTS